MNSQKTDSAVIRASELGEYVYCARAWWLHRQQGVASRNVAAMQSGRAAHQKHGRTVASALAERRLALLLAALAGLVAIGAIVMAIRGGL